MFKKFASLTLLTFLLISFLNCGKNEKKIDSSIHKIQSVEKNNDSSLIIEERVENSTTQKIDSKITKKEPAITAPEPIPTLRKTEPKSIAIPKNHKIYNNLSAILNAIQVGQTVTKEELIKQKKLPKDASSIIKSVKKTAENELYIEWKSTWLVEKVSDVKLNDDKIKVEFKDDIVYTSGPAIGIKYDGKIYTDLIIKGDRAYIPSVKEYSWRIGK